MIKFIKLLILVPAGAVILAFSIANRAAVTVSFDPFSPPEVSGAFIAGPLYIVLFATLALGVFIGGVATWLTQGVNRRKAREARHDAEAWQEEAMRLREKASPAMTLASRALTR